MTNITICGGGNLGHVVSGVLGSQDQVCLSLLTRHPERWQHTVTVTDLNGRRFEGRFHTISACAEDVIPQADVVLLCLPGFAIHDELVNIKPFLKADAKVGSIVSSTGFFFEALDILPAHITLFGFQRVPYISRTTVYGQEASLLGYKDQLYLAVERSDAPQTVCAQIEQLFVTPTALLQSHYEASLTNSNPLLHPARLFTMWSEWDGVTPYGHNPKFYAEWTDAASSILIAMDGEFQHLLTHLPVGEGSIPSILTYYESHDAASLTRKLRSIKAFQNILSPMKGNDHDGYEPDFGSRYFTEDFPYGMRFIVECAHKCGVAVPTIEKIYAWGCSKI